LQLGASRGESSELVNVRLALTGSHGQATFLAAQAEGGRALRSHPGPLVDVDVIHLVSLPLVAGRLLFVRISVHGRG
jgi:hypothetical protein